MDYKYLFNSSDRLCGAPVFCYQRLSIFLAAGWRTNVGTV